MTLLIPKAEAEVVTDKPRLHAFVIGVSDYPHLLNGSKALANDPLNLGQVTTPHHTALRITKWLSEEYTCANKPLGSIEFVFSPSPQVAAGPDVVERATFANIDAAFKRWVKRCSAHKDNTAFFYFCGHGLAKDEQFLLAEDFKDPAELDEWRNCINFDAMRVGMKSSKAQTQVFFVDACRETPFGMLSDVEVSGQKLITSKIGDNVKCSAAYYATTEGKQAYGPADEPTYFGRAVISCLNGLASGNSDGKWVVDSYSLSKSLGQVMHHYAEKYGQPLDFNPNVSGLGVFNEPGKARVIARIKCNSEEANAVAEIELRRNGVCHKLGVGDAKPLVEEVEPGDWEIIVKFPGGQFASPAPLSRTLLPALFEGVDVP